MLVIVDRSQRFQGQIGSNLEFYKHYGQTAFNLQACFRQDRNPTIGVKSNQCNRKILRICFQIRNTFFWYELNPKLKLFRKDNAMNFKIGGGNAGLYSFIFISENTFFCYKSTLQ